VGNSRSNNCSGCFILNRIFYMKTPEEFLKENNPLLPREQVENEGYLHISEVHNAMKMYSDYVTNKLSESIKFIFDSKEAECQSLREQIREMIDNL